jgi:hypothetical protein
MSRELECFEKRWMRFMIFFLKSLLNSSTSQLTYHTRDSSKFTWRTTQEMDRSSLPGYIYARIMQQSFGKAAKS